MTESQSPTVPSTATSATLASCQVRIRSAKRRTVSAGTTKSAATSSAPTIESAATIASAIRPSSASVEAAGAGPQRLGRAGVEAGREPAVAEQQRGERGGPGRDGGQGDVAVVDQEQAAEEQGLDVGAGAEDVAGEDRAGGQAADEDDRDGGVAAPPPRGGRAASCRRLKTTAAPKAPSGAAKPSPSASTSPGKAAVPTAWEKKASPRRTIQVPSRPAGTARISHLDQAALDEGQLEGLEHGPD